ncbi:protein of unknown function [Rhodovastum atsumiense]|nr:protein of unknown function [Rhodovastum atsumiense]
MGVARLHVVAGARQVDGVQVAGDMGEDIEVLGRDHAGDGGGLTDRDLGEDVVDACHAATPSRRGRGRIEVRRRSGIGVSLSRRETKVLNLQQNMNPVLPQRNTYVYAATQNQIALHEVVINYFQTNALLHCIARLIRLFLCFDLCCHH